jgi:hypothetical protein
MAKKIDVDALKVGDSVTVLERRDRDRSYIGEVFRVLAIDLPFVVVTTVACRYGRLENYKTSFDVRQITLGSVTPEYVKALSPESTSAAHVLLTLSDLDNSALQEAMNLRRSMVMPDHEGSEESNEDGEVIAEICRGWLEMVNRIPA